MYSVHLVQGDAIVTNKKKYGVSIKYWPSQITIFWTGDDQNEMHVLFISVMF